MIMFCLYNYCPINILIVLKSHALNVHTIHTPAFNYPIQHPERGSTDSNICDSCKEFWFEASMEVSEKKYFEWCRRTGESYLQNNIAEIYLIIDRSEWCLSFDSIPRDGSDIHRLPNRK